MLEGGAGSWASWEMRSAEFCQKIAAAWIKAHKIDLRIGLDNIPSHWAVDSNYLFLFG